MSLYLLRLNLVIAVAGVLIISCGSGTSSNSSQNPITYTAFKCPGTDNVAFPGVSGIRQVDGSTDVYVTGVYVQYGSVHGFLYKGPVLGGGTCSPFYFPSSSGITVTSTSLYGPDNNGANRVVVVGSYTTLESGPIQQLGFLYQGADDGSTVDGYTTLDPSSLESQSGESVINTLGHSTMGGIVVGNYDTRLITGKTFIYDITKKVFYGLSTPSGSASITAYGIWYNGGTSYTITGGYSSVLESGTNIGFITDWDSETQQISNFTTLNYNDLPASQADTHFEGITTDGHGGYNLSGDWNYTGDKTSPAFVHVPRNSDGTFGEATWTPFAYYPGSTWTSANTVYQNYILGLFQAGDPTRDYGYVVTINQ